jgi:SpoIID/LytB domain protein
MGMSQYGAQGAARLGCTYQQILERYYTDSTVTTAQMPSVLRLRMLEGGNRVDVTAETGDVAWQLTGCTLGCPPLQPAGSTWRLSLDPTNTRFQLSDAAAPFPPLWTGGSALEPLRLAHSTQVVRMITRKDSKVYLDRRLRWDFTTFTIDGAALDAVQSIEASSVGSAMDKYLWGIAEVPSSFPAEALKAQAVAARTYAAKRAGRVLMPTPADQNYTGYAKESEGPGASFGLIWKAAVDATSGQVLKTSAGAYVEGLYSSSFGGRSEDRRYVWGGSTLFPQLQSIDDSRWEMASSNSASNRSWARGFTREQVARALGLDLLTSISVAPPGEAGRLQGVQVTGVRLGAQVSKSMTGWDVRQALGLLSPGFTVQVNGIAGAGAVAVSGDWNGDGRTDLGWYREGRWSLRSANGSVRTLTFGEPGDLPVVGDWNGDRKDSVGVFRGDRWLLRNSNSTGRADLDFRYGQPGDQPVAGDWNGNIKDGIGVFRSGRWYLRNALSAGGSRFTFTFGAAGDVAVAGDWNRNRVDGIGVYRSGQWYLRNALSQGGSRYRLAYGGMSGDLPVVGDWERDRLETVGVARGATWHLRSGLASGGRTTKVVFRG